MIDRAATTRRGRRVVGGWSHRLRTVGDPWPGLPSDLRPGADPDVLTSYRVGDDERLALLGTTVRWLDGAVSGAPTTIRVQDASPDGWADRTRQLWGGTGLDVRLHHTSATLSDAYLALLDEVTGPCFALQFDDTLTPGVTASWLRAAAGLLEAPGLVDAVCPPPRLRVDRDEAGRSLRLVPYEQRGDRYRFAVGPWQRPLAVARIGEHAFGIFRTAMWGFYFNNLVARVDDYRRRFEWYREHVSATSVHAIELAAYEWRGPVWRRIAIPLDDVCLLDLDFAHTAAAVRAERPDQRALWEAVEDGWHIEVRPDTLS